VLKDADDVRLWTFQESKSVAEAMKRIFPRRQRIRKTPGEQALVLIKKLQQTMSDAAMDPDYEDAMAALHTMVQTLPTQRVA
jgi:hypothetical protein